MSFGYPSYSTGYAPPPEAKMNPPPPYSPVGGAGYPGMTPAPQVGPFYNPAVPFTSAIPTLQDGTMIYVQGTIPYGCTRFSVNLKQGADPNAHCLLHVNPRFEGTNQVVRNSCLNGCWGSEERHGGFPLVQGQSFEFIIMTTVSCFKMAFNGQHFAEFNHRFPKEHATHLIIDGNVTLTLVRVQPPVAPVFSPPIPLTVPYTAPFPYGLQPGKTLTISGVPGTTRFILDFLTATGDIAFHFAARLNESVVVRNSSVGGVWKNEERKQTYFPFQAGVPFSIIVLCEKHMFKVAVNGTHFIQFGHRMPMNQVKSMKIHGEVTLTNVQV